MADSGLVVVVIVISLLLVTVFLPLLTVQYEWCQVLFDNNTVSDECPHQPTYLSSVDCNVVHNGFSVKV